MRPTYEDIRGRIAEEPTWHDEHGCPRYGEFDPRSVPDIYATEAVLLAVECQGCGKAFYVALSSSKARRAFSRWRQGNPADVRGPTLAEQVRNRLINYGDPPNADCCSCGPVMNSEPRKVLQFWERRRFEWVRVPELEIDVTADCVGDDNDR